MEEQGLLLGSSKNMFPFRVYTLLAGGAAAIFAAYWMFGRKKKSAAEIERERRNWLNQIGRTAALPCANARITAAESSGPWSCTRMTSTTRQA